MASSNQPRGRGRPTTRPTGISTIDVVTPKRTDTTKSDTDVTSTSSDLQSSIPSQTTTMTSRGRGAHLRRNIVPPDPCWTVTDLTTQQFNSNARPSKPTELGKIGKQIQVMVNYFPILQFPHKGFVYKYDVQIRNRRDTEISFNHRRVLYHCWLKEFCRRHPQIDRYKIVFDNQKILFTFDQSLPNINGIGLIEMVTGPNRANRQEQYQFSIKQVGNPVDLSVLTLFKEVYATENNNNIKLEELENIKQVLSIVLHEHCSSHADFIYNRLFFSQPVLEDSYGTWDLGLGKVVWQGFYSCLVFAKGTHKLLMNLDVSHNVFMKKQPFLDFLCEVMRHSPCGRRYYAGKQNDEKAHETDVLRFLNPCTNVYYDGEIKFLLKQCRYLHVRSKNADNALVYEIHGIGEAASTQKFLWKSKHNQLDTVENYYKENRQLTLEYPSLPTLKMRNGFFLPMELVDVEPVKMKKITDEQRALLCQCSSLKPYDYYESIKQIRENPKQQCFEQDPFIAAWKLTIDVNMLKVPARILPMPGIVYTDQYQVIPEEHQSPGVWSSTRTLLHRPTDFPPVWGMINLSSLLTKDMCETFYAELRNVAADRGINCPPPVIYEEYNVQRRSIYQMIDMLKEIMNQNDDCKFFIVILPADDTIRDQVYGHLKTLCELEFGFGIVTQMIRARNAMISKKGDKYEWDYSKLNNILLKVNTKLDGINSILNVPDNIKQFFSQDDRIMYVGVDLSHGACGSNRRCSVVAVVASADDIPNRYFKEVYMQERPAQARGQSWEYIVDMKEIMKSLISQYKQHRDYPPRAIVIYRDGISNSEFDTVFGKELTATREACADLSPVYRPYLTYIVVNKRHHTRFFPIDSNDNVMAGTVVDSSDVTDPTAYDFYLYSHHGQKGTSRPAHYRVLYDDNKLKTDEVQMLTYALCYTYARCTRSVSIPAPVKYADILAFRAGFYIDSNDQLDRESVDSESSIPINEDVNVKNTIKSKRIVLSPKLALDSPFFL